MIIVPGGRVGLVGDGGNNEVATFTDATQIQGESNLTFDGSTLTVTGALTVGVDDTGHDVTFYGAASGKYMLWDESANSLKFPDSTYFYMGTGDDLVLFHDGSNSYVRDVGTGNLILSSNAAAVEIQTHGGASMATFTNSGAVELYHSNSKKLETHASGVEITGSLEVATIDYTDGDLAMTIADGGGVTFAQDVQLGTNVGVGVVPDSTINIRNVQTPSVIGDNNARYAQINDLYWHKTSAAYTSAVYGGYFVANISTANTQNWTNTLGLRGLYTKANVTAQAGGSAATITGMAGLHIGSNTVDTSGGTDAVVTNNYGLYIDNQTAGTNDYGVYIGGGDTYGLWVDSGITRLDGAITTYGDINVRGTTPDLILGDGGAEDTSIHFGGGTSNTVNGATTDTDWVIARDNTDYAFTLNTGDSINHIGSAQRFSFYHSGASTYAARFMGSHTQKNDNQILYGLGIGYDLVATERTTDSTIYWYAHCVIGTGTGGTVTTQGESQTIPLITSLYVDEPGITDSGDTITRGSTVYIENAPTEGDTANYALWVDSGKARLDDGVIIGPSDSTNNLIDNATNGSGASTLYIGNTSITTSSDARLKTDIESTSIDALNLIDELNVVDFGWDDPTDTIKYGKNYRGKYVGMLAQETVKVAPWIINDQGGGRDCTNCMAGLECDVHGMFQVEYQHLVPTLVKAIQELRQELQEVKGGNR